MLPDGYTISDFLQLSALGGSRRQTEGEESHGGRYSLWLIIPSNPSPPKGYCGPSPAIRGAKSRHIPGALWVAIHHSAVGQSLWRGGARRPTLSASQPFAFHTMSFLTPDIMSHSSVPPNLFLLCYFILDSLMFSGK